MGCHYTSSGRQGVKLFSVIKPQGFNGLRDETLDLRYPGRFEKKTISQSSDKKVESK